jgi:uncharacterized membrane protein YhhN
VTTFFFLACLLATLVDWLAVFKRRRGLEYIAKPTVIVLLLAWFLSNLYLKEETIWFAIGLVCSLVGDIMLMLPRSLFIQGWLAFLLAHLAYITGFNRIPPRFTLPGLLVAFVAALIAWQLYRRLAGPVRQKDHRLIAPVLIYTAVITLMLISALLNLFKSEWLLQNALLTGLGALSFFLSDSMLAWNRFVASSRYGRLPEMVAYHLGQILIIAGVILQFR